MPSSVSHSKSAARKPVPAKPTKTRPKLKKVSDNTTDAAQSDEPSWDEFAPFQFLDG